jgi:hypothetical protein
MNGWHEGENKNGLAHFRVSDLRACLDQGTQHLAGRWRAIVTGPLSVQVIDERSSIREAREYRRIRRQFQKALGAGMFADGYEEMALGLADMAIALQTVSHDGGS